MENASKALLMAAGILIGIIIVSLGIYLVSISRDFSEAYEGNIDMQKMQAFNAPFNACAGRENISPHEILTLANKANTFNNPDTALAGYYNNGKLNPTDSQYIHVYVKIPYVTKIIDLTDESTYPTKDGNGNTINSSKFISMFLDGSYVYSFDKNLEKYGQFEYEYEKDNVDGKKRRIYYNSYVNQTLDNIHPDIYVNSNTGRIEKITFVFQANVQI